MIRVNLLILIGVLIVFWQSQQEIKSLSLRITHLESSMLMNKDSVYRTNVIKKHINPQKGAILSIRCEDSNKKKKEEWHGTASKISESLILTADHMVTNSDLANKTKKTLPIKCELFSKGKKVGSYDSKNFYYRHNEKDLVVLGVSFNEEGKKLNSLKPIFKPIETGQTLILVSHPLGFMDDMIISFGLILNENANLILSKNKSRMPYWKDAILTDMSAAPGSSGSPLFNIDGEYIGIHVGGERESGLNTNYQLLFDAELLVKLSLLK